MDTNDDFNNTNNLFIHGFIMSCEKCKHNPTHKDNFELKEPEWHSRLWEGCPIMVNLNSVGTSVYNWWNGCDNFRLPTIEESPRNVWLLHSGEAKCPEGAEDLDVLLWWRESLSPSIIARGKNINEWGIVDKFMIIDRSAFK